MLPLTPHLAIKIGTPSWCRPKLAGFWRPCCATGARRVVNWPGAQKASSAQSALPNRAFVLSISRRSMRSSLWHWPNITPAPEKMFAGMFCHRQSSRHPGLAAHIAFRCACPTIDRITARYPPRIDHRALASSVCGQIGGGRPVTLRFIAACKAGASLFSHAPKLVAKGRIARPTPAYETGELLLLYSAKNSISVTSSLLFSLFLRHKILGQASANYFRTNLTLYW